MTDAEREEVRKQMQVVYDAAINDARADLSRDLRKLVERFVAELNELKVEIRRALGLSLSGERLQ